MKQKIKKEYWTIYQTFRSKKDADNYILGGHNHTVYFDDGIKEDNIYSEVYPNEKIKRTKRTLKRGEKNEFVSRKNTSKNRIRKRKKQ